MKKITLYTDGACSGNPGPGGYGAVLLFTDADGTLHRKELSAGYKRTTNNRMEIMGVIKGLEALKETCEVTLYTDSRYVADAVTKGWALRWQRNGWMRNKNEPALNVDLWKKMLTLLQLHKVYFIWVKGHANNVENEYCDRLARAAIGNRAAWLEDQS